jgi:acyl-CoA thioesterase I
MDSSSIRTIWLLALLALAAGWGCAPEEAPSTSADAESAVIRAAEGESSIGEDAELAGEADLPVAVFFGTSLTEGLGLDDPAREAWPARVEARARDAGISVRVVNAGLSGETTAGALRRVGWVVEGAGPDLFVLESGANDGLRGLPVEDMERNLDAVLEQVRSHAPGARLALVAMEAPPNMGEGYVTAYREVFARVAARHDAVLVPFLLEGVAGQRRLNQADGIHPTAEGHARMADHVWPVLEPLLREVAGARAGR